MVQIPPSKKGCNLFQVMQDGLSQQEAGKEKKKSKKRKSHGNEDVKVDRKRKKKKRVEKVVRELDSAGEEVVLEEIVEVDDGSESKEGKKGKKKKRKAAQGQGYGVGEEGEQIMKEDSVVDGQEESREGKKLRKRADRRAIIILDSQHAEDAQDEIDLDLVSEVTKYKDATGTVTEEKTTTGDAQQNPQKVFMISSSLMTPEALAAAEKQHARIRTVTAHWPANSMPTESAFEKPSAPNAARVTAIRTPVPLPQPIKPMKARGPKATVKPSPDPLQTPQATCMNEIEDSTSAFSRTVSALQTSLSSKVSKDIMVLNGKDISDDNYSVNLGPLFEKLNRASALKNSPSKVSKFGSAFKPEDKKPRKIVKIKEGWEESVGKVRSAVNENDDAQIQENIAFSSNYILSKNSGINIGKNSFHVYVLKPGGRLGLSADTANLQICSVASGKVVVKVGIVEFGIGAHGMWRVRVGEDCRAINIEEKEAVLHISKWN